MSEYGVKWCCRHFVCFPVSYTDDTSVEELQKIFLSAEGVVHKLEKEQAQLSQQHTGGKATSVAGKKRAAAAAQIEEECGEEELEEHRNIVRDWKNMKDMGWRELCTSFLLEEEREPVYFSGLNCLWSDRTVFVSYCSVFRLLSVCLTVSILFSTSICMWTWGRASRPRPSAAPP